MGLSNYVPNSRISQAGVIPNAAARPASPYEGMMVYQTDDNSLYIYDGSNWVKTVSAAQPPALELINTFTVSAQTTLTCDNVFSTAYTNYRVVINMAGSTTLNLLFMQYLNSSGTALTSSYYSHALGWDYATSGSTTPHVFNKTDGVSLAFLASAAASTQDRSNVSFDIYDPFSSTSATYSAGNYVGVNSGAYYSGGLTHGSYFGAVSMRGFRLLTSTNTNMTGIVRVYGYRN